MKIGEYKKIFVQKIAPFYDEIEAEQFFLMILENKFNLRRIDLALNPEQTFSREDISIWNFFEQSLEQFVPIQHLLGEAHFYGAIYKVDENVLIPRPETEELVDWIIDTCKKDHKNSTIKILDIGTGSGCIAISLAKNLPNAEVSAIDVSEKALLIAKENASKIGVNINFQHKNILTQTQLEDNYDIIVSNPPYIRELEKSEIKKNVLDYEPHLALFVSDNDPLIFYRKIAELSQNNLKNNGFLFYEINQYLGKQTVQMLEDKQYKFIELRKDFYQNDRMIKASLTTKDI